MRSSMIELLEDRRLLSASPLVAVAPALSTNAHHITAARHHGGGQSSLPTNLLADLNGFFNIGADQGYVDMNVTNISGRRLSGTIEFQTYDGDTVANVPFHVNVNKHDNFTFRVKSGRATSSSIKAGIQDDGSTILISCVVHGKFNGTNVNRYGAGGFAVGNI